MTRRRGFTLVELAVVMAVIVVLAAIAVPIALNAQVHAREAKLRATLKELRTAISSFTADCGGYPCKIDDVMQDKLPKHCHSPGDGSQMPVDRADFRGPYLIPTDGQMPTDPITRQRAWEYDKLTGEVRSCAQGTASDGTQYSEW